MGPVPFFFCAKEPIVAPKTEIRKSTRGRWRAAVLIGIHVAIAAHAAHFLVKGRTLSPIEPSESMYTLELGDLNAGFVFFAAAILATTIFGRFFCGWGCHLIALQDFCGWLMKRLGVRPRPFRSRFLIYVPLATALYMFVWPTFKRLAIEPRPFPGFSNDLMTQGFWETFPGPVFAVLTLATCGFAAVYFLGAKGFCTFGCPYGAVFVAADRLAPGRILVTDDCEQCGHCSATCTSNVRVAEEVNLYGMVVDPGCMKCMDCVSVCPKDALHFGFSRPSLARGAPQSKPPRRHYDFTVAEELVLVAVFLVATPAFRGLYDGPPLLMSIGLGAITAYVTLKLWRLFQAPGVRLQNLNLKLAGAWRNSGRVFAALAVAWLLFGVHSAYAQWHRNWGAYHLERTEAAHVDVLSGAFSRRSYTPQHHRAAEQVLHHFSRADRWGLFPVREVKLGLAWGRLLNGDPDSAEVAIRQALALTPEDPQQHQNLFDFLVARGRWPEAAEVLGSRLELVEPTAEEHFRLAGLLVQSGNLGEAAVQFEAAVELAPDAVESRFNLGGVLRRLGRNREALTQLGVAADLAPADPATHIELGLTRLAVGDTPGAIESLELARELDPDSPESRLNLAPLLERLRAGEEK